MTQLHAPSQEPATEAQQESPPHVTTAMDQRCLATQPQPGAEQNLPPTIKRTLPLIVNYNCFINLLRTPYFATVYLDIFGISLIPLAFQDGAVPDGEEQFLRPLPPSKVTEMLDKIKPWENPCRAYDLKPIGHLTLGMDNFAHSTSLWYCIVVYLTGCGLGEGQQTVLDCLTPWDLSYIKALDCRPKLHSGWETWGYMRYYLPNKFDHDTEKPHASCFLRSNLPLKEEQLSLSEVQSILLLATAIASEEQYIEHKIIPVIVVSCSGRRLRVVQGIVNFDPVSVQLRKTEIIDFELGVKGQNWENFLTLLGWMIGEPIGCTK